MKTDDEIYEEKKAFIQDKLLPLAQAIDSNIMDLSYHLVMHSPYDLEYVTIFWKNAYDQRVYVTGDSLLAECLTCVGDEYGRDTQCIVLNEHG